MNVTIYTDGSCRGNPGPGGWAAILKSGKFEKEISGGVAGETTAPRMEVQAVAEALAVLKEPCRVAVFSDNRYLVQGMMIWMHDWADKDWRKSNGQHIAHADLWQNIYSLCQTHKVFPVWVKAHNGNDLNERADALAKSAVPV